MRNSPLYGWNQSKQKLRKVLHVKQSNIWIRSLRTLILRLWINAQLQSIYRLHSRRLMRQASSLTKCSRITLRKRSTMLVSN